MVALLDEIYRDYAVDKFNMAQFFEPGFFPISFFYLGMLTRQDDFYPSPETGF